MAYDQLNRLTQELQPGGDAVYWAYDAVSRRTLAKGLTPGGDYLAAMAYGYDDAGRLTSVNGWGLAPWGVSAYGGSASYQYNANGSLTTKLLGNGLATYLAYDAANRLTSLRNRQAALQNLAQPPAA